MQLLSLVLALGWTNARSMLTVDDHLEHMQHTMDGWVYEHDEPAHHHDPHYHHDHPHGHYDDPHYDGHPPQHGDHVVFKVGGGSSL